MSVVFLGSEALAQGRFTEYELRRRHITIFRDVFVPKGHVPSLRDRIEGAWLRSGRKAVIAGVAASALHGAQWIDDDIWIELLWANTRPPRGIIARDETWGGDEITWRADLPVTTLARTAYDLGRHLRRGQAIARLDALMRAMPFSVEDVLILAKRYKGARGVRRLRAELPLVDPGAASPRETWLRLLLIDAGLPIPTTQIPVTVRYRTFAFLDMGWEEYRVAVEYDGDQHRSNRAQYVKDQRRLLTLTSELGWIVIRVIKEDNPDEVVVRARNALRARGWRG